MGLWDIPAKHEICDTELRFNPYHDPTTGRFTTANGGGSGAYLFSKGGKSAYVVASENFKKSAINAKYGGFSVTDDKGNVSYYTSRNNMVSGATHKLSDEDVMTAALMKHGNVQTVVDKLNQGGWKASIVSDSDIEKIKSEYAKELEKKKNIDYETGNPFHEHGWGARVKKSIYRPSRIKW